MWKTPTPPSTAQVQVRAKVTMPLQDMFWADRYGKVEDPFGHHWAIASRIEDLTPEEIAKRAAGAFASAENP
jgi:PhnB protein